MMVGDETGDGDVSNKLAASSGEDEVKCVPIFVGSSFNKLRPAHFLNKLSKLAPFTVVRHVDMDVEVTSNNHFRASINGRLQ